MSQPTNRRLVTEAALATEKVNAVTTSGATQTIPATTVATVNRITLTANCTFTFPTAVAGKSFTLVLVQDGTGSRTVTWPGTVQWANSGIVPTLSTAPGKRDSFSFMCDDGTTWTGYATGKNY